MPGSIVSHNSTFFEKMSMKSSFLSNKEVHVAVQLLDDAETISAEFKRSDPSQAILDYVLDIMNIKETDYFGLRYQDHEKHRYWVDLSKPISHMARQFKFTVPDTLTLRLRFRFYPSNPYLLREEITRYQFFVQLQRDLLHGRLYCPQGTAAHLAALILQSQLGDYNPEIHGEHYACKYKLLLKQTPKLEDRIEELHREMRGKLTTSEAEFEFLKRACELDTYGFDPYTIKDSRDSTQPVYFGVTHRGILIYKGNIKAHQIPWNQLSKVDYLGHELKITPTDDYVPPITAVDIDSEENKENQHSPKEKKHAIKFVCPNTMFAKHLWKHILAEQAFFNEASASTLAPKFSKPRIPLLGRGSSFHFPSRRVLHEIETANQVSPIREVSFLRYGLPKQEPRVEAPWLNKNHALNGSKILNGNGDLNRNLEKNENNLNMSACEERQSSLLDEMAKLVMIPEASTDATQTEDTEITDTLNRPKALPILSGESPTIASSNTQFSSVTRTENKVEVKGTKPSPTSLQIGEPVMTSTPTETSRLIKRSCKVVEETTSVPITNGHLKTNGTSLSPKPAKVDEKTSTRSQFLINSIFISLLVVLLGLTLMITLFEMHPEEEYTSTWFLIDWHPSSPNWVSSNPTMSRIRQEYYEPVRHSFLSLYKKFIPQR